MTREFTFDMTLTGTGRVKAESRADADKKLREIMALYEHTFETGESSFTLGSIEGELDLMEIDGEAV